MTSRSTRRDILWWLGAGAGFLSPMYRRLVAEAAGAVARPCLVTMATTNGCTFTFSNQKTPGPLVNLHPVIAALTPHKDKILFINNFYTTVNRGLHGPGVGYTGRGSGGPSFDQWVANQVGKADPFPSISMAMPERRVSNPGMPIVPALAKGLEPVDALGKTVGVPHILDAFSKVFGSGVPAGSGSGSNAAPRPSLAFDKSVLDYAVEDTKRMQARLAGPERVKLDHYLTSLRGIEAQMNKLAMAMQAPTSLSCKSPAAPAVQPFDAARGGKMASGDHVVCEMYLRAAAQFAVLSIQCGMTTVVNIDASELPHTWAHGDPAEIANFFRARYNQVAYLFDLMKATPWGGGTLLDSTLFFHHTDCSSHHSAASGDDMVAILMGGLVSKAMPTGRAVALPNRKHMMNDIFSTMAALMGAPAPGDKFGDPAYCTGPLTV